MTEYVLRVRATRTVTVAGHWKSVPYSCRHFHSKTKWEGDTFMAWINSYRTEVREEKRIYSNGADYADGSYFARKSLRDLSYSNISIIQIREAEKAIL